MKVYQELTAVPIDSIPYHQIMAKMMENIHIAIAEVSSDHYTDCYGVSFPDYHSRGMGSKVRIFAHTKEELEALRIKERLSRIGDYIHVTSVRETPKETKYAIFRRVRANSRMHQAKYIARKTGENWQNVLDKLLSEKGEFTLKLPFLHVHSYSTGQRMMMFVKRNIVSKPCAEGVFGTYGINNKTNSRTVPWF